MIISFMPNELASVASLRRLTPNPIIARRMPTGSSNATSPSSSEPAISPIKTATAPGAESSEKWSVAFSPALTCTVGLPEFAATTASTRCSFPPPAGSGVSAPVASRSARCLRLTRLCTPSARPCFTDGSAATAILPIGGDLSAAGRDEILQSGELWIELNNAEAAPNVGVNLNGRRLTPIGTEGAWAKFDPQPSQYRLGRNELAVRAANVDANVESLPDIVHVESRVKDGQDRQSARWLKRFSTWCSVFVDQDVPCSSLFWKVGKHGAVCYSDIRNALQDLHR